MGSAAHYFGHQDGYAEGYAAGMADEHKISAEVRAERDRYREALVLIYGEAPPLIARVCDEIVDRSGRLLGELRHGWRVLNQQQKPEEGS